MQKQVFIPVVLLIAAINISSGQKYCFQKREKSSQKIFNSHPYIRYFSDSMLSTKE